MLCGHIRFLIETVVVETSKKADSNENSKK
jgi:hypothetical protein